MNDLGYKREGDRVTLTMTVSDYENLLLMLGYATGVSFNTDLLWRQIALVNRLNAGNPEYTPYQIPEEHRTPHADPA